MMADKHLPNNDPDLKLAQAIGQARADDNSLSELDDWVVTPLVEHRKRVHQRQRSKSIDKQQVWQQIDQTTNPERKAAPIYQLFTMRSFYRAAAAMILIGALFSFLYIQFWQGPELLARAGTSIKTVQLKDGSTVTLRPHSKLFAVEQSASTLLYKLKGEALFEVTPKRHRIFSVKTENGRVSVLGTRFILSSWGNSMQVFLEEGLVSVKSEEIINVITLQPGEAVAITDAGKVKRMPNAKAREFTDWLDQQLIFNSKSAGRIISELEQQFNISISLPADIANNRLSGQLSLKSLQVALNDLGLVLNGTFARTGERSYRFEAK